MEEIFSTHPGTAEMEMDEYLHIGLPEPGSDQGYGGKALGYLNQLISQSSWQGDLCGV